VHDDEASDEIGDEIGVVHQGGIAIVSLRRPDKLNAITPAMGRSYATALRSCASHPDVRVIVVRGEGKGFCAGADLAMLAQGPDALEGFLEEQRRDSPTIALDLPVPVVTVVHGPAAGLGFVIALASDMCFVGPRARFIPAFPRLGLVAEYSIAWLLLQRIGSLRTNDILLTGRDVDANTAAAWGLADGPHEDPLAAALTWAETVAHQCSPSSVSTIKGQIRRAAHQERSDALMESLDLMRASFRGPDLPEALLARSAGRPPVFAPRSTT
jgi:enoyl-CoA hydratase/carnithine racemase